MKKNIPFWTVPPIIAVPVEGAAVVGGTSSSKLQVF